MRSLLMIVIISLSISSLDTLKGQEIVSVEYNSTLNVVLGQLLTLTLGIQTDLQFDSDFYVVRYTTTGSDMRPDTASGLFMLPAGATGPLPILCYQHGTTDGRFDVPSRFGGAYQLGALFSAKGMAVVAPDFLGMGDSRGFHPYVHAETEATAAVDMIRALKTYMDEQSLEYSDQLFITGYSQGGHAAMALHQYIEQEIPDEMTVTASLPMSGPYSISGVMRDLAFNDEEFFFPSYLVYSTRGLKEIYPDLYGDESELFQAPYLADIASFVSTGEGLSDLNVSLVSELINQNGMSITKNLYKDSVRNILSTQPDHPFNLALAESDVYDWTPDAPVLMLYCPSDDQVPFRNSIVADSVMNARGAADVSAEDVSGGRDLDHGDCAIPALNRGIPWLFSFIDKTTSTKEIDVVAGLKVYPTIADQSILVTADMDIHRIEVYDLTGARLAQMSPRSTQATIDVTAMMDGMYILTTRTDAGLSTTKVVVAK